MAEEKKQTNKESIIEEPENKSIHTSAFKKLVGKCDRHDADEIDELIERMYAAGCRPIVSVKGSDVEKHLKEGIDPGISWTPEAGPITVGTFGTSPYHPEDQDRAYILLNIPRENIAPRYSGPNHDFSGIVYLGYNKRYGPEFLELFEEEPDPIPNESALIEETRFEAQQL